MEKAPKGKCDTCSLVKGIFVPSEVYDTSVVAVTEAPSYHEVQEGLPLVGVAGRDFNKVVSDCGGKRGDMTIINAVSCRPTKEDNGKTFTRTPTDTEIRCCSDRLAYELEAIQPVRILCMGKIPYIALGGDPRVAMKDITGTEFLWRDKYPVIITYHPAAISHSGGVGTQRGKGIRDELAKAVRLSLSTRHSDRQLTLIDYPRKYDPDRQSILTDMDIFKEKCDRWYSGTEKCKDCRQKFYCLT